MEVEKIYGSLIRMAATAAAGAVCRHRRRCGGIPPLPSPSLPPFSSFLGSSLSICQTRRVARVTVPSSADAPPPHPPLKKEDVKRIMSTGEGEGRERAERDVEGRRRTA